MKSTIYEYIQPKPIDFAAIQQLAGGNELAWQEIIFDTSPNWNNNEPDFMGVDVLWGRPESPELLFGSDFRSDSLDASSGSMKVRNCPWDVVIPFCQTVLVLCKTQMVLPFVRIGVQRFQLKDFDYEKKSWTHRLWNPKVKALALPDYREQ